MSRITPIDVAAATGETRALLDGVKAKLGVVPNLVRVLATAPAALAAYVGFSGALAKGALDGRTKERIALATAEVNGCDYCLAAHSFIGAKVGLDAKEIAAARTGASADPRAAAIARFARTVAETRGQVTDADLAAVRAAGLTDGEIVEVVSHVALNVLTNFVNNVARTEVDFPAARPLAA